MEMSYLGGNDDETQPSTSTPGRSFKNLVQKHFTRDRVFTLVHDLLRSIEDEKRAQNDLIHSFREARLANECIPQSSAPKSEVQKHSGASCRPKRRRRRYSDVPLIERIALARKQSLATSDIAGGRQSVFDEKQELNNNDNNVNEEHIKTEPEYDSTREHASEKHSLNDGLFDSHEEGNCINTDKGCYNDKYHNIDESIKTSDQFDQCDPIIHVKQFTAQNTQTGEANQTCVEENRSHVYNDRTENLKNTSLHLNTPSHRDKSKQQSNRGSSNNTKVGRPSEDTDKRISTEHKTDDTCISKITCHNNKVDDLSTPTTILTDVDNFSNFNRARPDHRVGENECIALDTFIKRNGLESFDETESRPKNSYMPRNIKEAESELNGNKRDEFCKPTICEARSSQQFGEDIRGETRSDRIPESVLEKSETKEKVSRVPTECYKYNKIVKVEVESASYSSEDDNATASVNIVGSDVKAQCSDSEQVSSDDNDYDDDDRRTFLSVMEYSNDKKPASVQPKLDSIAEASTESFPALSRSSGSESRSVIEIQTKDGEKGSNKTGKNRVPGAYRKLSTHKQKDKSNKKANGWVSSSISNDSCSNNEYSTSQTFANNGVTEMDGHKRKKQGRPKSSGRKGKLLNLDLLGLYEDNIDLQKVHLHEIKPRKERHHSVSPERRHRSKSPRKHRGKDQRKYDMTPLPPKYSSGTPQILRTSKAESRGLSSHSVCSGTSHESRSSDQPKYVFIKSNESMYKSPDRVLWHNLDLSSDSDRERTGKATGMLVNTDDRKVTRLPLRDAIKRVKSAITVPELRHIIDLTPRQERVGKLFIDLKKERRGSLGTGDYRRLEVSPRDYDDDVW